MGGKRQSGESEVEISYYVYYAGFHLVPCVTAEEVHLLQLQFNDRDAFVGDYLPSNFYIDQPNLFGGFKKEGGVVGEFRFKAGWADQTVDDYLSYAIYYPIPAYRGVISLVAVQPELQTNNPFLKAPAMKLACIHGTWNLGNAKIYGPKTTVTYEWVPIESEIFQCFWSKFAMGDCGIAGLISPDYDFEWEVPATPTVEPENWYYTSIEVPTGEEEQEQTEIPYDEGNIVPPPGQEPPPETEVIWDWIYTGGQEVRYDPWKGLCALVVTETTTTILLGQNPAHIFWVGLTNREWGKGLPVSRLDEPSFLSAATTLYNEKFALSIAWTSQVSIDAFLKLLADHVGASLALDPVTNKYKLRLLRPGQDPDLYITPEHIVRFESYEESGWANTTNEITVKYVDIEDGKEKSVTVQDLAAIERNGGLVNSETQTYNGLPTLTLAERVARRDLSAATLPMRKVELAVDRTYFTVMEGQVAAVTYPAYNLDESQFRVVSVDYGTPEDNEIFIVAVTDITLEQDAGTIIENPPPPPQPVEPINVSPRYAMEAPYWLVDRLRTNLGFFPDGLDPTDSMLMAIGCKPQPNATGYLSRLTVSGATSNGTSGLFSGMIVTLHGIPRIATEAWLDKTNQRDIGKFVPGSFVVMGTREIAQVVSLDTAKWKITLNRGLFDTVPQAFSGPFRILTVSTTEAAFFARPMEMDEPYSVKLLTKTTRGDLLESLAEEMTGVISGRQGRPLPPGNFRINGTYLDRLFTGDLTVTWAHRNRLTQIVDTPVLINDGNVVPEEGTEYRLRIYDKDNTLVVSELIPATETPTYTFTDEQTIFGSYLGILKVELKSIRDTLESYTFWSQQILRQVHTYSNILVNNNFATGTLTGWETVVGVPEAVNRSALSFPDAALSNYVLGNPPANMSSPWHVRQTVDLTALIDTVPLAEGEYGVHVQILHRKYSGSPRANVFIELLNSNGAVVKTIKSPPFEFATGSWGTHTSLIIANGVVASARVNVVAVDPTNVIGGYLGAVVANLTGILYSPIVDYYYQEVPLSWRNASRVAGAYYANLNTETKVAYLSSASSTNTTYFAALEVQYEVPASAEEYILQFNRLQAGTWYDDDYTDAGFNVYWIPNKTLNSLTYPTTSGQYGRLDTSYPLVLARHKRTAPYPLYPTAVVVNALTATGGASLGNITIAADGTGTLKMKLLKLSVLAYKVIWYQNDTIVSEVTLSGEMPVSGLFVLHFRNYYRTATETLSDFKVTYKAPVSAPINDGQYLEMWANTALILDGED